MKRFLVTRKQLTEYVEKKKAEKTFNAILTDMYNNSRYLSENVSVVKANKNVIKEYERKKLLTPKVKDMLKEHNLLDEKSTVL